MTNNFFFNSNKKIRNTKLKKIEIKIKTNKARKLKITL